MVKEKTTRRLNMNKRILMKVTSRERPEILLNTIKNYYDLASDTTNMYWLFTFDENDRSYNNDQFLMSLYASIGNIKNSDNVEIVFGVSTNKINAINRDINSCKFDWDILLNISDDQIPTIIGYDNDIRELMPDTLDASLWFNDGWQDRINTQEIIGKKYYDRFKYVYNNQYYSFFCDNEATEVAQSINKLIKSNRCIIKHYHPQWDKNSHIPEDALYRANNLNWKHDQNVYNLRKRNSFK